MNDSGTSKGKEWTRVDILEERYGIASSALPVSNSSFSVPEGLWFQESFVSETEEIELVKDIDHGDFTKEGFEQRRRVQRFSFESSSPSPESDGTTSVDATKHTPPPSSFVLLRDRIERATGHRALHVVVEEHISEWSRWNSSSGGGGGNGSSQVPNNKRVTTFESLPLCSCAKHSKDAADVCTCFVACIPLRKAAVQYLNKPRRRQVSCWDLASPKCHTNVLLTRGSLLVKTQDCLWNWRSRLAASSECSERVFILKLYSFNKVSFSNQPAQSQIGEDEVFGYMGKDEERLDPAAGESMPPLEDLLTIIVTTSPVRSNPSTELLEKAMGTFVYGGCDFAYKCRKVIVCDGFRTKDAAGGNNNVTRKHANVKQAMRNGVVTGKQGENYRAYIAKIRALCEKNATEPSSVFYNAVVEELEERQGYGFALRHALHNCVSTRFVCVIQHDRTFMRTTPIHETVHAMWRHAELKYIGYSMRSNLMYRDIFLTKYGASYLGDLRDLIRRVPELQTHPSRYGPGSQSTKNMTFSSSRLRDNILALVETYRSSTQFAMEQEALNKNSDLSLSSSSSKNDGVGRHHQISLTPTLFWYDNIHICETAHYRDFIFDPQYKMVARGGFVEDKLSPVILRTVERLGLQEGHARFGCFLLDDHSGMFFTGHLDGGAYMTDQEKQQLAVDSSNR